MKNILNILDKKLGYLIFILESRAFGTLIGFDLGISINEVWFSLRLLSLSFLQKLTIIKANYKHDKFLFRKEFFNTLSICFFSNLRTGISLSVRFATDTSMSTLRKLIRIYEGIECSNDDKQIYYAQNKINRILAIYKDLMFRRRPFYTVSKNRDSKNIPFRLSQLNSIIFFISIDIMGLNIGFYPSVRVRSLLIFLFGFGLGFFLF